MDDFSHIRTWIFDLDNTLYPPEADLFSQIEGRMTAWLMATLEIDRVAADRTRRDYWSRYGTTLSGLIAEHGADPAPYLTDVHDIDLGHLIPDPVLARRIATLRGRRVVFTNGSAPYAARVLAARGLSDAFHAVYGVEDADHVSKPDAAAFEAIVAREGCDPTRAAMFEDVARNLVVPHLMGMRTVLVGPEASDASHVDHHTTDLSDFLSRLA